MRKVVNFKELISLHEKLISKLKTHLSAINTEAESLNHIDLNHVAILLDLEGDSKMLAKVARDLINLEQCEVDVPESIRDLLD